MTIRLERDPNLWAFPFALLFDTRFVSVGCLCVWCCVEWERPPEPDGLVELRAVGVDFDRRLAPSVN
jgi:hypothetical protein